MSKSKRYICWPEPTMECITAGCDDCLDGPPKSRQQIRHQAKALGLRVNGTQVDLGFTRLGR